MFPPFFRFFSLCLLISSPLYATQAPLTMRRNLMPLTFQNLVVMERLVRETGIADDVQLYAEPRNEIVILRTSEQWCDRAYYTFAEDDTSIASPQISYLPMTLAFLKAFRYIQNNRLEDARQLLQQIETLCPPSR